MTLTFSNGKRVALSGGVKTLLTRSIGPNELPKPPIFNPAATTKPLEITQGGVGGNNRRNSQAAIDAHDASEAALLAIYGNTSAPAKVATQSGFLDEAATWGGTAPVNGDKILIPLGVTVWLRQSTPTIKVCFCLGRFFVKPDITATVDIETFIGDRTSCFWIGDQFRPFTGSLTWTQPQTSLNLTEDPNMQGKGIVLLGRCRIHGRFVTPFALTDGVDVLAGATSLTLDAVPTNVEVGHEIAIQPTRPINPGSTNSGTLDPGNEVERRVITSITNGGKTLNWTTGLTYDHAQPTEAKNKGDSGIYVAFLTRNIRFDSPPAAAVHERGHFMLMHTNGDADIRNAEFAYMGRTDKRANAWAFADHPDQVANGGSGMTATSNIFGRYGGPHWHLNGPDSTDNNHMEGCSFHDGFGLGCVVHGSRADVKNNCSADFNGAHFLTEAGNEDGVFEDWLAIGLLTDTPDFTNKAHVARHDWGKNQLIWFQSRTPTVKRMRAFGASNGTGIVWNIRGSKPRDIRVEALARRGIKPIGRYFYYANDLTGEFYDANQALIKTPPLDVEDLVVGACLRGIHVIKAGSQQDHNMYSKMDKIRLYNVGVGMEVEYTARYWVNDVCGVEDSRMYGISPQFEVLCYQAIEAFQFTWRNIEGYGFNYGVDIDHIEAGTLGPTPADGDWHNFVITPDTNVLAGTYRIDDINRTRVGTTARDEIRNENSISVVTPSYTEDTVTMPDFTGSTRIWSGSVTDSLGTRTLPAGRDVQQVKDNWARGQGRLKGPWERDPDGQYFLEVDELVTDAGTGEHFTHTGRLLCADGACAADPRAGSGWIPGTLNGTKA